MAIPLELLIQIVGYVGGFGVMWGVLRGEIKSLHSSVGGVRSDIERLTEASLPQRVQELERHTPKVEQIAPLVERMSQLERRFETEFERVRDDIRELSKGVRDLASALVSKNRPAA